MQLTRVAAWTRRRQDNAARLDAELSGVTVPGVAEGAVHVYHQYTVRVPEDRDGFAAARSVSGRSMSARNGARRCTGTG